MVGCRSFADSAQDPCSGQARVDRRFRCVVSQPSQSLGRKFTSSPTPKGNPVESKIGRIEAALKVLGQEHSDAHSCLEDVLKKVKGGGGLQRCVQPPTRRFCCGSPREGGSFGGIFGSSGPRRRRRTAMSSRRHCRRSGFARQVAPVGQRLDECDKYCERAAKRLEKAQEVVTEVLKAQTLREEELAEGKRRLEVLRAEAAAQPAPEPPSCPGTDELIHLRRQVPQMEGELRQSHRTVSEKTVAESTLKQRVEHLMQEGRSVEGSCAASRWGQKFKKRHWSPPFIGQGSGKMEETDKKSLRITDVGGASSTL